MIDYNLLKFLLIIPFCMSKSKCSSSSCILGKSSNKYGGARIGTCFEVQLANLKGLSIHTLTNVVGFTFHSINGTNQLRIHRVRD